MIRDSAKKWRSHLATNAEVAPDVEQASRREKVEAELREVESIAPAEAKALRYAAHRYHSTVGGLEAKAELYRAAKALAKAVR